MRADLVAMTQVKLPARPKLELARNFWDDMGVGRRRHAWTYAGADLKGLGLTPRLEGTFWDSLWLANAMTALSTTRPYVYQPIRAWRCRVNRL